MQMLNDQIVTHVDKFHHKQNSLTLTLKITFQKSNTKLSCNLLIHRLYQEGFWVNNLFVSHVVHICEESKYQQSMLKNQK